MIVKLGTLTKCKKNETASDRDKIAIKAFPNDELIKIENDDL